MFSSNLGGLSYNIEKYIRIFVDYITYIKIEYEYLIVMSLLCLILGNNFYMKVQLGFSEKKSIFMARLIGSLLKRAVL